MSDNQKKDGLSAIHQVYFEPKRFKRFTLENSKSFFALSTSFFDNHSQSQQASNWVE